MQVLRETCAALAVLVIVMSFQVYAQQVQPGGWAETCPLSARLSALDSVPTQGVRRLRDFEKAVKEGFERIVAINAPWWLFTGHCTVGVWRTAGWSNGDARIHVVFSVADSVGKAHKYFMEHYSVGSMGKEPIDRFAHEAYISRWAGGFEAAFRLGCMVVKLGIAQGPVAERTVDGQLFAYLLRQEVQRISSTSRIPCDTRESS